jgi:hypothetical protein
MILVEDSTSQSRRRDKSILRNNFLTEEVPYIKRAAVIPDSASIMILDVND